MRSATSKQVPHRICSLRVNMDAQISRLDKRKNQGIRFRNLFDRHGRNSRGEAPVECFNRRIREDGISGVCRMHAIERVRAAPPPLLR